MNIPNLDQIKDFVTKTENAVAVITSSGSSIGDDIRAALPAASSLAGTILNLYFPEAQVFGFSATKLLSTVTDLADAKDGPGTDLSAAFDELKAVATGAPGPTHEAWVAFNAEADKVHDDFQAALAVYKG